MEKIRKKSSGKRAGSVSLWLILCLACLLLLGGCRKKEEMHPTAGEDGVYQIYYLNSTRTGLASVSYQTETTDAEILIGELAGQILAAPENPEYQAVLSDKVEFLDINRDNNVLTLNFNQEYMNMKASREILCRAALAKTFTQVEGVDYISINCEGQPLLDTHGNPVGAIAGSDFVDSISDVNSYEKVELTLYFANEEKDGLVAEKREVFHSMNTSLERLVVEQLLAGSQNGGLSVMPKNTKVLNVSLTDNTCYVNLDSGFISRDIDVAEYIPIYAIVDSLTELQTVNKVQITVNGSADVTYRNVISLAQPLEREEKYIVK